MVYQASLSNVIISCCVMLVLAIVISSSHESHIIFSDPPQHFVHVLIKIASAIPISLEFQKKNEVKRWKINWLITRISCDGEEYCNNDISNHYLSITQVTGKTQLPNIKFKAVVCKQNRSSITYNYVKNNKYLRTKWYCSNYHVAYSYSTANKMHLLSHICYPRKTLYIFRTVLPSIIRSSKLRTQQRHMSNSCCYLLLSGMRWNCCFISSPIAAVWHIPLLYTQFWAPDDGRKDCPKHVERFIRVTNLR
jgi:hypothetical protein